MPGLSLQVREQGPARPPGLTFRGSGWTVNKRMCTYQGRLTDSETGSQIQLTHVRMHPLSFPTVFIRLGKAANSQPAPRKLLFWGCSPLEVFCLFPRPELTGTQVAGFSTAPPVQAPERRTPDVILRAGPSGCAASPPSLRSAGSPFQPQWRRRTVTCKGIKQTPPRGLIAGPASLTSHLLDPSVVEKIRNLVSLSGTLQLAITTMALKKVT